MYFSVTQYSKSEEIRVKLRVLFINKFFPEDTKGWLFFNKAKIVGARSICEPTL